MKFNSSTVVSTEKAALIRHYLDEEPTCEEECFVDDSIVTVVNFPNGYDMELWCSGVSDYDPDDTNTALGEAMLFDDFGGDAGYESFESSAEYFSPHTLKDGRGNEYTAYIIVAKED